MPSVFLCHASEDKLQVEPMQLALANSGCEVFFDQESLPPGGDYHARIREAIKRCDVFVFVASSASVAAGKFTLSELKFARERWPSPINRVLPVALAGMKPNELPQYLQAVTILGVSGNAAAEVRAAVEVMLKELARQKRRSRLVWTLPAVLLIVAGIGTWWPQQKAETGSEDAVLVGEPRVIASRDEAVRILSSDQYSAIDQLRTDPARAAQMFSDNFVAVDAWLAKHSGDVELMTLAGYAAKNIFASTEEQLLPRARAEYLARAERMFQQALDLSPQDASAINGLGNVRYYQGNLGAAISLHEKALQLQPDYQAAKHDLELVKRSKKNQQPLAR